MHLMASAFIVLGLFACGGGGGGGGDDDAVVVPTPLQTSSPEGLYTGRTSSGRLATGIILNDNTFYLLYSTIGFDDEIAGLVQGNLTLGDNTYTSTDAKDFNLEGLGVLPATVEGSYVEKQSTSGSVYYPTLLETLSFDAVYDAAYELTPSIATITGSYSGEVVTSEGWETAAFTISPTGILSGSGSSGCSVSGSVLPSTSGNTYNMTLTFGGPPCLFENQTLSGVSYYNTPESWLTGAVINATRTDGVLFTGQKSALPPTGQCVGEVIAPLNLTIGTPLNQTIEAYGTKFYVFDVVDPATYTIYLYDMATDNDWILLEYISNCEDDYPINPPTIAGSSNGLTSPDIKDIVLSPKKYLLIVDEYDNQPSSYKLLVTSRAITPPMATKQSPTTQPGWFGNKVIRGITILTIMPYPIAKTWFWVETPIGGFLQKTS
jgi:hypothetical protein